MYFVCEFGLLLVWNWKNGRSKTKSILDSTTTAHFRIRNYWKSPQTRNFVVGQGSCGLINMTKKVGEGMNPVKNSGFFLACNAVVMLKIEERPGYTAKGCSSAGETNKNKKGWFLSFFYNVRNGHFCSCPNSKGDILQKSWLFLAFMGYLNLKDILLNAQNWQLTFARLKKLQCFQAV